MTLVKHRTERRGLGNSSNKFEAYLHRSVSMVESKEKVNCAMEKKHVYPTDCRYPESYFWHIHTAQERDQDQYRKLHWHNRKQLLRDPSPGSDQCEHFYVVLYFPCTGPSSIPVQCEYTITTILVTEIN